MPDTPAPAAGPTAPEARTAGHRIAGAEIGVLDGHWIRLGHPPDTLDLIPDDDAAVAVERVRAWVAQQVDDANARLAAERDAAARKVRETAQDNGELRKQLAAIDLIIHRVGLDQRCRDQDVLDIRRLCMTDAPAPVAEAATGETWEDIETAEEAKAQRPADAPAPPPAPPPAGEAVEEDGDEVFTPMPTKCRVWLNYPRHGQCNGDVKPDGGFHKCQKCGVSYGPVQSDAPAPPAPAPQDSERLRNAIRERGCSECGHSPRMNADGTCPILRGQPQCPRHEFARGLIPTAQPPSPADDGAAKPDPKIATAEFEEWRIKRANVNPRAAWMAAYASAWDAALKYAAGAKGGVK